MILTCPGGNDGQHQWKREGRGRPPRFCPKHDPRKNGNKSPSKTEDITAPEPASDNSETRSNPFIERSRNPFIEKAKRAAEERPPEPKPKPVDLRSREERIFEEAEAIDEKVKRANQKYTDVFMTAVTYPGNEDPHEEAREAAQLWDKADKAQNTLVNLLNRQRVLNAELEKLTAPAAA